MDIEKPKPNELRQAIFNTLQQCVGLSKKDKFGRVIVEINDVPMYNMVISIIQNNFEHIFKLTQNECNKEGATLESVKKYIQDRFDELEAARKAQQPSKIIKP